MNDRARSILVVLFVATSYLKTAKSDDCTAAETVASGTFAASTAPRCSGELLFEDTFDRFDLEKWQHDVTLSGGGNWEFQYYTNNRSNSYTENGHLHIRPTLLAEEYGESFLRSGVLDVNGAEPASQCTDAAYFGCSRKGTPLHYLNPIKSAKIRTSESFAFRYGRVIVRAKLPAGDWLWPAIWMMPRYNSYGTWPASGEIDILEGRGNRNLVKDGKHVGNQQVSSTMHWGPFPRFNEFWKTHYTANDARGYNDDFHDYELVWTSNNLTFYVDQVMIGTVVPGEGGFWELGGFASVDNPWKGATRMAPFDQKFYLIINLAVGGTSFFSDTSDNLGGKPWKNNSTTAFRDFWRGKDQWLPTWNMHNNDTHLIVDSIRVYSV